MLLRLQQRDFIPWLTTRRCGGIRFREGEIGGKVMTLMMMLMKSIVAVVDERFDADVDVDFGSILDDDDVRAQRRESTSMMLSRG